MKLSFDTLVIENFKSFIDRHIFKLNRQPGLHSVQGLNEDEPSLGSNGAGKSSIFDALCWVLFGRTIDGLRNADVRPWKAGAGRTYVGLEFNIDGHECELLRYTDPNELSLAYKDESFGPVDQAALERKLRLSLTIFRHTILLGQGQPLFVDLPPREKMAILSDALELERWVERSQRADEEATKIKTILDRLTGQAGALENAHDELRMLIGKTSLVYDEWDIDKAKTVLAEINELKDLQGRFKIIDARRDKLSLEYDYAATEAKGERQELERIDAKSREANMARSEHDREVGKVMAAADHLGGKWHKLADTDLCPTCGQSIDNKHRDALQKQYDQLIKEAKAMRRPELVEQSEEISKQWNETVKRCKHFGAKADQARDAFTDLQSDHAKVKAQIEQLKLRIEKRDNEINPHHHQLMDLRKRSRTLKSELAEVQKELVLLGRQHAQVLYWVKGFKDLRLYIVEEILQELEMSSNFMLEQLGLIGWEMFYSVEKETQSGTIQRGINLWVASPHYKKPVKLEAWSGGERQRLRLNSALALSEVLLNHVGLEPNIAILDEPTTFLSGIGVSDVIELLDYRARWLGRAVYFADHRSLSSGAFASTTMITKDEAGSFIE